MGNHVKNPHWLDAEEKQRASAKIRVRTDYATEDDLVAGFDGVIDRRTIFLPTHQMRPVGDRLAFTVALRGGDAVLRGEGELIESYLGAGGPNGQQGMMIRVRRIDPGYGALFDRLVARPPALLPEPEPPEPTIIVEPALVEEATAASPAPAPPSAALATPRRRLAALAFGAGVVASVVVAYELGRSHALELTAGLAYAAREPRPIAVAMPVPAPVAIHASAAAAELAAAAAPFLAPSCAVTVLSDPPDAEVRIAGQSAGRTPLRAARVACGTADVTIERPRYERVERRLSTLPGSTLMLDEHLARPMGTLVLVSDPPGAIFFVNGVPVGASPARASVRVFERVRVEARLGGHDDWSQMVYLPELRATVNAHLDPSL